MSNQISEKVYDRTMRDVANYLSGEKDISNIESAIYLWGYFQKEYQGPALGSEWQEAQDLLYSFITKRAS
jgi:hypothetical protein